jgi:hypothetical protein
MADLAWSAWLDEVLPWAAKAPRAFAQNAIRDSAIRLCKEARVYYLESDAINIVANTKEYAWAKATVTNAEPFEIWQAFHSAAELEPATRDDLVKWYTNWATETGTPLNFLRMRPSTVRLVPYPSASVTAGLVLHAFMAPKRSATGIVDEIGERYFYDIGVGARAKLLAVPKTPYYQPDLAAKFERDFNEAITKCALSAEQGETGASNEGEGSFY